MVQYESQNATVIHIRVATKFNLNLTVGGLIQLSMRSFIFNNYDRFTETISIYFR